MSLIPNLTEFRSHLKLFSTQKGHLEVNINVVNGITTKVKPQERAEMEQQRFSDSDTR